MDNFDWNRENYKGQALIFSHQISIPSRYWPLLIRAVKRGAKLIVEGTTGYFDECQVCVMQTGFPLAGLLGGSVSEFKVAGEKFDIPFRDERILPAHLWIGIIKNVSGESLSAAGGELLKHGIISGGAKHAGFLRCSVWSRGSMTIPLCRTGS